MTFISSYPWWFLLFCMATGILFAYLLYGRRSYVFHEKEHKGWRYGLAFIRFLSTALIAFLLLSLLIKHKKTEEEKPVIIVLQDNSSSLSVSFGGFPKDQYKKALGALQYKIKEKFELISYSFGNTLSVYQTPDFSEKETDISNALEEVFTRHGSQNIGAIVLASDGIFNKGNSPLYIKNALAVPVYTIALGDTAIKKDAMIKSVRYPEIVYLGDQFTINVQIEANHLKGQNTTLEITAPDGKVILNKVIQVTEDRFTYQTDAIADAPRPGVQQYKVKLRTLAGEAIAENNYDLAYVEVLDGRQKVLMLYDAPHPDVKAFKNAIEQNKNYEFEQADIKIFKGNYKKADLLILYGLPSLNTTGSLPLIQEMMGSGKPLLLVLSAATNVAQFNTLQNILQITGTSQNGNDVYPVYQPSFSKFTTNENTIKGIQSLPPLLAPYGKYLAATTSDIFLKQQIGNVPTNNPLILMNEVNGKKTGIICGEGIWRWRMNEFLQNNNFDATDEIINKCVQYLTVKADKRRFRVHTPKNIYNANESIQLDAELYNETYELVNDVDASCVVKGDNGKEYPFVFDKTINAYFLNAGVLPVGNYMANAKATYKGNTNTAVCSFSVRPVLIETLYTQANHSLLRVLSVQSGGKLYYPNTMQSIADDLEKNNQVKSILYDTFSTRPLIDIKWIFGLILLLLISEWFIRKYNGNI
ncbi:MAG: VWA domain-containing protein [Sphingobacteriales bacterium]|nr:VWA domain-containing protein [Sphingobacteriales bacterium]